MDVISTEQELEDFLSKCTPWGEDDCFEFFHHNGTGLFSKEQEHSGKAWAVRMISEGQDWSCSEMPDSLPLNAAGCYRYLIKPTAFDFDKDVNCISKDFLYPWDSSSNSTRWYNTATDKGNLRQGVSKHSKYNNIKRYITFYADPKQRPLSKVLYQYVIEATKEKKFKKQSSSQVVKRKSEPIKRLGISSETQQIAPKRRRTVLQPVVQVEGTSSSSVTSLQGTTKEKKPKIPSPPMTEITMATPDSMMQHKHHDDTLLIDLDNAHRDLQRIVNDTRNRYCALTNPIEMIGTNNTLIKLVCLQSEFQAKLADLVERTKQMTQEILTTPYQVPIVEID